MLDYTNPRHLTMQDLRTAIRETVTQMIKHPRGSAEYDHARFRGNNLRQELYLRKRGL